MAAGGRIGLCLKSYKPFIMICLSQYVFGLGHSFLFLKDSLLPHSFPDPKKNPLHPNQTLSLYSPQVDGIDEKAI
jgi:hypothetical protein